MLKKSNLSTSIVEKACLLLSWALGLQGELVMQKDDLSEIVRCLTQVPGSAQSPSPLVGRFYISADSETNPPLFFVASERVCDTTISTVKAIKATEEGAMVVVLSSYGDQEQEILALESGADDFLSPPVNFARITAHLRSLAARYTQNGRSKPAPDWADVDQKRHKATLNGQALHLSPMEFRLFAELWQNRGAVLPYERLQQILWQQTGPDYQQPLKQAVHRLRSRLGDHKDCIRNVPGFGYIYSPEPSD